MAATPLTVIARTDLSAVTGGTVGTVTTPASGSNKGIDWTGLVKGVAFSIRYLVSGTNAAIIVSVVESATGYDITAQGVSTTGTGTSTSKELADAIVADSVAGTIVSYALHAGNDGSGVIAATVNKAASTGQADQTGVTDVALASLDVANGNTFVNTGAELLTIYNSDAGTAQVEIGGPNGLSQGVEIDAGAVVTMNLPLARWGAAPTINGPDAGVKLAVTSSPSAAVEGADLIAETAAAGIEDVITILRALRNDTGSTALERRVYRRLLHAADVASRRITGTDQALVGGNHDTL